METYQTGDIVRAEGAVRKGGLRVRIEEIYFQPGESAQFPHGYATFIPVRKDGEPDRRWVGWSGSLKGMVKEEPIEKGQ